VFDRLWSVYPPPALLQNPTQNFEPLNDYMTHHVPPRPGPRSAVPSRRTMPILRVRIGSGQRQSASNRGDRHTIHHTTGLYALLCPGSQRIGNLWGCDLRPTGGVQGTVRG
jgi:hypothetical protein